MLWNRSRANAEKALAGIEKVIEILAFDIDKLAAEIKPGDIIVSMLPGDWHVRIARTCVDKGAHFVSSSYISTDMSVLNASAKQKGLCLVNEVGLDPGIDHLLRMHWSVNTRTRKNMILITASAFVPIVADFQISPMTFAINSVGHRLAFEGIENAFKEY